MTAQPIAQSFTWGDFRITLSAMEIHRSSAKHGAAAEDVLHAVQHQIVTVGLDPDADPPKVLVIGPDSSGNLLEVIVLVLPDDRTLAIHAMKLRPKFYELLPGEEGPA